MADSIIREKRIISLNSNNATTYGNGSYLSDLTYDFANILSPDNSIVYVECGLGSAEIPVTFYSVNETNNIFNYRVNSTNFSINVPFGNYNYNSLVTQMTTLFTANGHTFTFALNRNSNILTMTLTTGTWNQINASSIYYILGFDPNTTYNIVGNTITFPRLFNLLGIKKIKLYSTFLATDSYDSVNKTTSNLLATISVYQPGFSMVTYQNLDGLYGHLRTRYLSTIDIQLKDELGDFINFNGINFTLTINLIIYRRIDTLLNELKLQENIIQEDNAERVHKGYPFNEVLLRSKTHYVVRGKTRYVVRGKTRRQNAIYENKYVNKK